MGHIKATLILEPIHHHLLHEPLQGVLLGVHGEAHALKISIHFHIFESILPIFNMLDKNMNK